MTKRTSLLTRCLALALALVLILANVNLGVALRAFAAEGEKFLDTELLNSVYGGIGGSLTSAEMDLLASGMLVSTEYSAAAFNPDGLVEVDAENKQITAKPDGNWIPREALIQANGEIQEVVKFEDGVATYTYDGKGISIDVMYTLYIEIPAAEQEALLNAAWLMKNGVANMNAVAETDTNLGVTVAALPALDAMIVNGGSLASAELIAAVDALKAQVAANEGKLDLQVLIAAYGEAVSKAEYAVTNGAAVKAEIAETLANLKAISGDALLNHSKLDAMLQAQDSANYTKWMAFKSCLSTLVADLEKVAAADWTNTTKLAKGVNYTKLDGIVDQAFKATSANIQTLVPAAWESVDWKEETMMDVNLVIALGDTKVTGTVAVDKEATDAEIIAAAKATGVEAGAVAKWEIDVAHYDRAEAITTEGGVKTYTVTYTLKNYTVTYGYQDAQTVPYGTEIVLPAHEDVNKSYDYTVNGEAYLQGEKIVIEGDTTITREEGKAYTFTKLYQVVANNADNQIIADILTSGALKGDKTIAVRLPDESLLNFYDGELTADDYESWKPYSYKTKTGVSYFNGANTVTVSGVEAKVVYRMNLAGYDGAAIIKMAKDMKAEADAQVAALDRLKAYETDMATLNKTQLGAFVGMVAYTDLTPADGDDTDAKNQELRAYFTNIINSIISNNLTGTNLTIYNMVTEYKNGGLRYYYENAEAVRNEVVSLSDNLTGLSGDAEKETALAELLKAAGKPEYVDKITNLGKVMAEVKAGLTLPNAAIDVESANLPALIDALAVKGELNTADVTVPYLESAELTAKDSSTVNVTVKINIAGKTANVTTPAVARETVLDAATINTLIADVEKAVADLVGAEKAPYYICTASENLSALVGKTLTEDLAYERNYVAKTFTVKIDGEADQTISVENLYVTLPAHTDYPTYSYDYTFKGETINVRAAAVSRGFTVADLATLFADGTYTIARTANNKTQIDFEDAFETEINDIVYDASGKIVGLTSNVDGSNIVEFAMDLVNSGYSYIALNGETLLNTYTNDANETVTDVSVQTLINALLKDNGFGSARLIALADGTTKTMLNAKMSIRYTEDEKLFEDIDFTLNLKSVPSQLVTVGNGLNAVKNYMTFKSNNGVMDVSLNLPEPIYEAYLTALLTTSNLEKTNINAMNQQIAFSFLQDYLDLIMAETDISADTYENTLNMMIKEFNEVADKEVGTVELSKYDAYYSILERALNGETVTLTANPDDYTIDISAKSEDLNEFLGMIGVEIPAAYKAMIKELKEGQKIDMTVVAVLENADVDVQAAVIDLAKRETTRKTVEKVFDYTPNLTARVADLKGESVIVLLDDVTGNLTFNHATILDLNGKTITGSIHANSKLFIIDSSLNTVSGGGVTGNISGDVTILAGTYNSDVSAFLKDGYMQKDGSVQNAVYYYDNGNVVINTNFMFEECVDGYLPAVHYLATDLAIDMILNYYTAASLTIANNDIYAISFDDLVGILGTDSNSGKVANLVDDLLAMIRFDGAAPGNGGIDDLVNLIIADLLDLEGISESIKNGTKLGEYTITTQAWSVAVKHVTNGDYITVGVVPNKDITNTITLSLTFDGSNKDKVLPYIDELARIIDNETYFKLDLDQPYRDGKTLVVSGGVEGLLSLDFSHNEQYIRMLCVVLAYGNPDAFGDIANADVKDLLAAIDATTVGEVFTALKVVAEKTGYKIIDKVEGKFDVDVEAALEKIPFKTIASKVGVELTDAQAAKLDKLYDQFMNGVCKLLNKMDLSDNTTPMSRWKIAEGVYYIDGDIKAHHADAYYRGYGLDVTLEGVFAGLKIKLVDDCMWGDVNHDNKVTPLDASLILEYYADLNPADFVCEKRADVNCDGKISPLDAALVLEYYAELIPELPHVEG
ncbi:MAG: hypothetical protein IJ422_03985 [Oscillospiraceae bacterium]|nr:hypothetical protein [Oscillospiraceae bacterium]